MEYYTLHRLIEFEKEGYARIGVMPRYGDAESVMWFDVEPSCMFHLINCFEEGDEVRSILQIVSLFHILVTIFNSIIFPTSKSFQIPTIYTANFILSW